MGRRGLPRLLLASSLIVVSSTTAAAAAASTHIRDLSAPARSQSAEVQPLASHSFRLAALINGRLMLWQGDVRSESKIHGTLKAIGPIGGSPGNTVFAFTWSSNGRYLAFAQRSNQDSSGTIVWYDTATGQRVAWPLDYPSLWEFGVTQTGVDVFSGEQSPTQIISHLVSGKTTRRSVKMKTFMIAAGYSGGLVTGPAYPGTEMWRVTNTGLVTPFAALPKPPSGSPPYETMSVSSDGKVAAIELGDHTDGCGVGPASRLFVVDKEVVHEVLLPHGPIWRVDSYAFEPSDMLDVTMVDCSISLTEKMLPLPTTVFSVSPEGKIVTERSETLVATAAGGLLALQRGHDAMTTLDDNAAVVSIPAGPLAINNESVGLPSGPAVVEWAP